MTDKAASAKLKWKDGEAAYGEYSLKLSSMRKPSYAHPFVYLEVHRNGELLRKVNFGSFPGNWRTKVQKQVQEKLEHYTRAKDAA